MSNRNRGLSRDIKETLLIPPYLHLSANRVPYAQTNMKFGYGTVGTSFIPIWNEGIAKTFRTTQTTFTVSSDDSNDNGSGSGAQKIYLQGCDANYTQIDDTVTLNGTAGVNTNKEFMIVERMYIPDGGVGSGLKNAGNIYAGTGTITAGKPATVEAKIDAGEGQTTTGWFIVPAGYSCYITNWFVSSARSGNANVDVTLQSKSSTGAWRIRNKHVLYQDSVNQEMSASLLVGEKSIVKAEGRLSTGTAPISINISYLLLGDEFSWPGGNL